MGKKMKLLTGDTLVELHDTQMIIHRNDVGIQIKT